MTYGEPDNIPTEVEASDQEGNNNLPEVVVVPVQPHGRKWRLIGIIAVLLVGLAGGTIWWYRKSHAQPNINQKTSVAGFVYTLPAGYDAVSHPLSSPDTGTGISYKEGYQIVYNISKVKNVDQLIWGGALQDDVLWLSPRRLSHDSANVTRYASGQAAMTVTEQFALKNKAVHISFGTMKGVYFIDQTTLMATIDVGSTDYYIRAQGRCNNQAECNRMIGILQTIQSK